MKASEFAYWLQGMFELCDPKTLDERQVDLIKRHLALVFVHDIDPKAGPPETQEKLNKLHGGAAASYPFQAATKQVYRC
jgi:hypothetical protein